MYPQWKQNKLFYVLTAVLFVYAIAWLGVSVQNKILQARVIGKEPRAFARVSVDGEGKITTAPNIARIDLGLLTDKASVQEAQQENSEKMNRLVAEVKKLGIEEKDIQTTQYQIYPQYDYKEGETNLRGYSVSQSVNVKIRDLQKISAVLGIAGEVGANQVGGLQFTLDDEENLRAEARAIAIAKAQMKAQELARTLGVRLVRLVVFNESSFAPPGPTSLYALRDFGGESAAPQVESGSFEVRVNVSLTYEVE